MECPVYKCTSTLLAQTHLSSIAIAEIGVAWLDNKRPRTQPLSLFGVAARKLRFCNYRVDSVLWNEGTYKMLATKSTHIYVSTESNQRVGSQKM